jgi:ribosome-binding protein aMBF1 (putative translation factor)
MPRRRTAFDRDFDQWMTDPEFAAGYTRSRTRIDAIDSLMQQLDAAREEKCISKANLARQLGMEPSVVRRLFTRPEPNPLVGTMVEIADLLGLDVVLMPRETDAAAEPRHEIRAAERPAPYATAP